MKHKNIDFKVGYVFNRAHDEIHYIKLGSRFDLRRKYSSNFTKDENKAMKFTDQNEAKSIILNIVSKLQKNDPSFVAVIKTTDGFSHLH